ncbi:ABC transporter permease [Anaerocolumna sp. MB42-C2]|uniref:ABC transporter permease n=1 Tax=Anaerocolumna sp. MB42-C2 TaxID=3070997 RepID=UPI0027E023CE|nr:ABC transporter permease [Anaerocolumna sp. MB42-C2]WMJ90485.1 ABC transporter permease [Anaerocolumna sp. MB42-C2]
MGAVRAFYWEIKLELVSAFRYRFGVLTDIVVFTILLSFFLMSDTGSSYVKTYQYDNYKEIILFGYIAWIYSISAISTISQVISNELRHGTFYKKMHSKYPLQFLLFGRLIASLVLETAVIFVLVILSRFVWNVHISLDILIILAVTINTLGMYGIGLFVAGLSVFFKRTGSILFLIQLGLLFVTDTIPTKVSISSIIPLTTCNIIIKKRLAGQNLGLDFLILCITTIILLILGVLIFSIFLKLAKKKGNLLFY